ncbi:MAG: DUF3991 domain-containing protein [Thermomicrobiales bacterium]
MAQDDFRRRADALRTIPLEVVLEAWNATPDRRDKHQWRTERGPLTVTGSQFFHWHTARGGGGAIDLVMHLGDLDVRGAIDWLARHLADHVDMGRATHHTRMRPTSVPTHTGPSYKPNHKYRSLCLPAKSVVHRTRVEHYLTQERALSTRIITWLFDRGMFYADARGNAVFLMVAGKPHRAVGAELRGTGLHTWRGLVRGTRRDAGYFWIGSSAARKIVLCESAIDAISCLQIHARSTEDSSPRRTSSDVDTICISTAGVRSSAPWLPPLLQRGYTIYCGFDRDEPGEAAARRMCQHYPRIQRLRPPAHDWNDALKASR